MKIYIEAVSRDFSKTKHDESWTEVESTSPTPTFTKVEALAGVAFKENYLKEGRMDVINAAYERLFLELKERNNLDKVTEFVIDRG